MTSNIFTLLSFSQAYPIVVLLSWNIYNYNDFQYLHTIVVLASVPYRGAIVLE